MLFRRTFYLFGAVVAVALAGWLIPSAHWPTSLWLPAVLIAVFIAGPFFLALDIRDGRKAKRADAPEASGR